MVNLRLLPSLRRYVPWLCRSFQAFQGHPPERYGEPASCSGSVGLVLGSMYSGEKLLLHSDLCRHRDPVADDERERHRIRCEQGYPDRDNHDADQKRPTGDAPVGQGFRSNVSTMTGS